MNKIQLSYSLFLILVTVIWKDSRGDIPSGWKIIIFNLSHEKKIFKNIIIMLGLEDK